MTTTKFDTRATVQKSALSRLAPSASASSRVELDNILASTNAQLTPTLELRASDPVSRVITVGSNVVTDSENGWKKTTNPIKKLIPSFASGTVTFPSSPTGNVTVSPGTSSITLALTSGQYQKIGIHLSFNGNLILSQGTTGASEAAATPPAAVRNALAIGYVVIQNVGGTIQTVSNANIYQYASSGGGSGGGGLSTEVKSAAFTAEIAIHYLTNTSSAAFTATLPAGEEGAVIRFSDTGLTWDTKPLTLTPASGEAIGSAAANDSLVCDVKGSWVQLNWDGSKWAIETAALYLNTDSILNGGNTIGSPISIGTNDSYSLTLETNGTPRIAISNTGALSFPGASLTSAALASAVSDETGSGSLVFGTSPNITTPTGIVKGDVGLGNVDNTSDANKPVSTAQQTALNLKANLASPTFTGTVTLPSGQALTAPVLDQALLSEGAAPSTPASGKVAIYAKADKKIYTKDSTGAEIQVGSGNSSGINYITNPDAEASTTGWATYADAAGATPVDGTGGSPSSTFTRNTTTPLRGNADFKWSKGAANRQGEGFSYDFTISTVDKSRKLSISVDLNTNTTNYAAGDLVCYVYDVTNSTLITPSSTSVPKLTGTHYITFDSTTSVSYRLIFHTATTNATAYDLYFDNFQVGPGQITQGAAISEWQSYTPTGSWTTNSSYTGRWRRVGDSMEVQVSVDTSGAPTGTALTINLPGGYTINSTALANTSQGRPTLGAGQALDAATRGYPLVVVYNLSTSVSFRSAETTGAAGSEVTHTNPFTFGAGDNLTGIFTVPIAEWAGSGTVNLGAGAQVEYASSNGTSTIYGPAGSLIPTITASAVTTTTVHSLTFQYPIQSSDLLILETKRTDVNYWTPVSDEGSDGYRTFTLQNAGANRWYGMGIQRDASDARKIYVEFGNAGASTSGNGYASVGTSFPIASGDVYRVRKVNASSPVGFGLASSTASGLINYYSEDDVTLASVQWDPNGSGVNSSSFAVKCTRVGRTVTLTFPRSSDATGAGGTTSSLALTVALASGFRPASIIDFPVFIYSNAALEPTPGLMEITSGGAISVFRTAAGIAFGTGQCGLERVSITYTV